MFEKVAKEKPPIVKCSSFQFQTNCVLLKKERRKERRKETRKGGGERKAAERTGAERKGLAPCHSFVVLTLRRVELEL